MNEPRDDTEAGGDALAARYHDAVRRDAEAQREPAARVREAALLYARTLAQGRAAPQAEPGAEAAAPPPDDDLLEPVAPAAARAANDTHWRIAALASLVIAGLATVIGVHWHRGEPAAVVAQAPEAQPAAAEPKAADVEPDMPAAEPRVAVGANANLPAARPAAAPRSEQAAVAAATPNPGKAATPAVPAAPPAAAKTAAPAIAAAGPAAARPAPQVLAAAPPVRTPPQVSAAQKANASAYGMIPRNAATDTAPADAAASSPGAQAMSAAEARARLMASLARPAHESDPAQWWAYIAGLHARGRVKEADIEWIRLHERFPAFKPPPGSPYGSDTADRPTDKPAEQPAQ
jgi:hypothetical protein